VIGVMVLQKSMALPKCELGFPHKTCVTSTVDGNTVASIEDERVYHITEEEDQDLMTVPSIKTEPNESCVSVVSVTPISYTLYPELPTPIYLCPCETKL